MQLPTRIVPLVTTAKVTQAKEFYQRHFGFGVVFDNQEHVCVAAPHDDKLQLSFMAPKGAAGEFSGQGLIYCFEVENVDAEHQRLQVEGLTVERPLQDNPWGDRSFTVRDPTGAEVYLYQIIAPSAEFAQYYLK